MKTNTKLLQVANLVAFVATIVVNTLASNVGLFGAQTGAHSDGIPNLFVPAGLTFSVWGSSTCCCGTAGSSYCR